MKGALPRRLIGVEPGRRASDEMAASGGAAGVVAWWREGAAWPSDAELSEVAAAARSRGLAFLVRVPPVRDPGIEFALSAAIRVAPDALVLADSVGTRDVEQLSTKLSVREAEGGLPVGGIAVLAGVTDSPAGSLAVTEFARFRPVRLAGLVCDGPALARSLRCAEDSGAVRAARSAAVLAAGAAALPCYAVVRSEDEERESAAEGATGVVVLCSEACLL